MESCEHLQEPTQLKTRLFQAEASFLEAARAGC